ncbi:S1 family peptidase [Streptomyces pratensis]|uniref:S1 family peptidase n=1 Tax=Streptomyces pratensis TaxID=1169025 RepID=UPI0036275764
MTAEWRSDVLETSQVRIRLPDGEVIGAGFLIAADIVCTCAHVVAQVFDLPDSLEEAPSGSVDLDFPLLPARPSARASVVSWRHGGADVALLRLDMPVEGARPAALVDGTSVWKHSFRVLGYPDGADHGIWVSGTLRAEQGSGLLQMEAQLPGPRDHGGRVPHGRCPAGGDPRARPRPRPGLLEGGPGRGRWIRRCGRPCR